MYFSYLACNFALGASFGDLGFFTNFWGYCCFGIIKVNYGVWCWVPLICHVFLKAKGVFSSSFLSNSNIVCYLVVCLCLSSSRFILGN
jgi:hypothetical protein